MLIGSLDRHSIGLSIAEPNLTNDINALENVTLDFLPLACKVF